MIPKRKVWKCVKEKERRTRCKKQRVSITEDYTIKGRDKTRID